MRILLYSFYQGADAFRTQHFTNLLTAFKYAYGLQVWPERPASSFLRPGTVATKRRRFSTMCTLRHNATSFYNSGIQNLIEYLLLLLGQQPSNLTTIHN